MIPTNITIQNKTVQIVQITVIITPRPVFTKSLRLSQVVGLNPVLIYLFRFCAAFNTVQVISRRVVGRAEETSTYSSSGFCTVNCRPTASNYQLSHLRPCREANPGLRGGRQECYHSATVAPNPVLKLSFCLSQVLS